MSAIDRVRAHREELAQEAKLLRLRQILVKSFGDLLARLASRSDLTPEDVDVVAQHIINQLAKHPEALVEYLRTARGGYNQDAAIKRLSDVIFGDE